MVSQIGRVAAVPVLTLLHIFFPFPFRTDRSLRAIPYVTYSLLFLNICIHLAALRYSEAEFYQFHMHWGLVLGQPRLVTVVTHAFLHADWMHLLSNLLILWIVGTVLEAGIGSLQFLLLYLASMLSAVLLEGIIGRVFQPDVFNIPMIGASGAIAGITGFAAFRFYHIRVQNFIFILNFFGVPGWLPVFPVPVAFWAPFWLYAAYFGGKELLFGIVKLSSHEVGGTAHWAHLGGMGLGLLAALLLRSFQEGHREQTLENTARMASGETPQQQHSYQDLQRLLSEQPNDPELLEAMAGLALANGEVEESRALYLKAIPIFYKNGRTDRAAIGYLNVLRHSPDTAFAPRQQFTLASTLETLEHYVEAADAFTLIYHHHPHSEEAQTALLRAAQIYAKHLQSATDATSLLELLLEAYPHTPWDTIARDRLQEIKRRAETER